MKEIVAVIFDQKFRVILLVALAHVLVPSFGGVYNYYYTEYLHFSPITMGQIHFVAISAYICAIFIVNVYFKGVSFKSFFLTTNWLSTLLYASNFILLFRLNKKYGISDHLFCFSSTALSSFMAELTFLPILALGSRVCPPGLEGTTYAVFTAIFNSASYFSASMGAGLVWAYGVQKGDFSNLWKLTAIQICCLLVFGVAVFFVNFPRIGGSKPAEDLKQSATFSSLSRDRHDLVSRGQFFNSVDERVGLQGEVGGCKSVEEPTASTVRIAKRKSGTFHRARYHGNESMIDTSPGRVGKRPMKSASKAEF